MKKDKISYIILHHNRPYFLDINIKLIRKYLPEAEIIVADHNSDISVITEISKMQPDKFTHSVFECSNVIIAARKMCTGEYVVFSEDDFIYSPNPVFTHVKGDSEGKYIMPEIHFPDKPLYNVFYESINLLNSNQKIKQIQLVRNLFFDGKIHVSNKCIPRWFYLDHSMMPRYYYCNWPYMMRKNELSALGRNDSIADVESQQEKAFNNKFGKGDWAVCPIYPRYIHIGRGLSNQPNITGGSRIKTNHNIQRKGLGKLLTKDVHKFAGMMTKWYVKGQFKVDFDELIENGLNEAFMSAFKRLRSYL